MKTITLNQTIHFVPARTLKCECNHTRCSTHLRRRTCKGVAVTFASERFDSPVHDDVAICEDCVRDEIYAHKHTAPIAEKRLHRSAHAL